MNKLRACSNNALCAATLGGLIATLVGGIVVTLATSYLTTYLVERKITAASGEIITRNDLADAIKKAKSRIVATGYVLSDINADLIKGRMEESPNFIATIVMVDPLGVGGSNRIICQRQRDEEGDLSNFEDYSEILKKLREFRAPIKTRNLIGSRLTLGLIDLYPTMTVMLIDDDLYVYFYPYGDGANSPVIKFSDYVHTRDKRGAFFDEHLNKITGYRERVRDSKTKFLRTDADFKPYEDADMNPPCVFIKPKT